MKTNQYRLRHYKQIFLLLLLYFISNMVKAQVDNQYLYNPILINVADSGKFGFSFFNNNYMRNTEYYNKIEVGRTLFGYQLMPSIFYQVNSHVKLQGGLFLRKDFGGIEPYTSVIPTFTFQLNQNNWLINFGNIEGNIQHRMAEPNFDIASFIEHPLENGFQLKQDSKKMFFDLWINWEHFIERGATEKEKLTAGINYQPHILYTQNGIIFTPIVQGMLSHRGGQIDKDTISFFVIANINAGFRLTKENKNSFIKEWKLEPYVMYYHQNDGNIYPFDGGSAIYINAAAKSKNISLMCSYFNGNKFISPKGTPLYSSVSLDLPGYTETQRQLLFLRFFYEKQVFDKINMSLRLEPYYDFKSGLLEYSYSVYLCYRGNWLFGKR